MTVQQLNSSGSSVDSPRSSQRVSLASTEDLTESEASETHRNNQHKHENDSENDDETDDDDDDDEHSDDQSDDEYVVVNSDHEVFYLYGVIVLLYVVFVFWNIQQDS